MRVKKLFLCAALVAALVAPASAFAAPAYVGVVDSRAVVDTGNTLALTVGAGGVAAGDTAIVVGAKGNDQEAIASVTDARGNAYRVDQQLHGPLYTGMSMTVVSAYVTTALQPGDTITIQYEGAAAYTNRFGAAYDFSGLAPSAYDASTSTGGYASTVTSLPTQSTQDGDLVFGLYEFQTAATAFTPETGLNALPQVAGAVANLILQPTWKIAGAAGAQSVSGTTSAFVSWDVDAVTYKSGAPLAPTAPASTSPPTVSGTARAGSTLTASPGTWTGTAPIAYAYAWQRCDSVPACTTVGSAATYALTSADVGFTLRVAVTATNSVGSSSATSAATPTIAAAPVPSAAPSYVQTIATGSVTDGASNTLVLGVPASGVSAGDTVIVIGAKGNDQAAIASVTDSGGNVYTVDRQLHGPAGSGMSMTVVSGFAATALQPGDRITITYEGTTAYTNRFGAAYEFAGIAQGGRDQSISGGTYGSQATTGLMPATNQDSELVLGVFESQPASAAFTPGAGLTALPAVSGAVVNLSLQPVYKVVGAVGQYDASGTYGGLTSWDAIGVTYRAGSGTPAAPTAPANTVAPAISGTPRDGSTLAASTGTWTGTTPISYGYQWQRCDGGGTCTNVGTGAATYTLGPADVGSTVRVVVTATNSVGSAAATSGGVAVTAAAPVNTAAPTVAGNPQTGSTLSAAPGTWTGTAPIAYAYQWQRCDGGGAACSAIAGATTSSYTLVSADAGATLRVVVTASNAGGNSTATSSATSTITAPGAANGPRFVKDVGSGAVTNASSNTVAITVGTGGVAAGDTVILTAAKGNDQAAIASVSDSRGNTYSVDANFLGAAGSSMAFGVASGYVATALVSGDRITVTFQGTTGYSNRWGVAYEFAGLAVAPKDVTASASGYGTKLSTGLTTPTTAQSELVLGSFDVQATSPGFTAGAGFQALTTSVGNTAGQALVSEFKVVSAAGQQQATATLSANRSWQGTVVTYMSATGPSNTAPPTVSGSVSQGSTLTASPGTWSGTQPISYGYRWQRCDSSGSSCTDLPGATGSTYVVVSGDVGGALRVVVTATNGAGASSSPSATTAVVSGDVSATPPVTSGIQLWFEANTEATGNGQPLARWHDKSGFARDLTASLPAQAPLFHAAALNGRATIEFDGVGQLLKTYGSTFTIRQPSTFFIVYRSLDANTSSRAFVFDSADSTLRQTFGRPAGSSIRMYADADLDFTGVAYPFPSFQVWTGSFNTFTSSLWRNGQLVGTGNAGDSLSSGFAVGGLSTAGNAGYDFSHFQVAEILYYGASLADADRQAVVNWLNLKYGVF